jgi:hypothetical protein
MTYYPERQSFLAFPTTNLCEYDIARNAWTRLTPAGTAPNCYSLNVCYDTLNKVFCCFYNGDFYYYSPVQNQWRSMGNGFTMARPFHHHIYDPVNNVHIVAGNSGGWVTYAYKFSDTPGKYPGTGLTAALETGNPAAGGATLSVYPNPFTPATTIRLADGHAGGSAVISVYDVRGKCVDRFQAEHSRLRAGLAWEADGLSCGVYLLRVKTAGGEFNRIVFLAR